jgi:thioredoxin reductase (NADPH)
MAPTIMDTRRDQIFPTLAPEEIDRLRRFGVPCGFAAGEYLLRVGEQSPGMFLILQGTVAITWKDARGRELPVIEEGPGQFLAELAQLSGRPALVDARAKTNLEALLIVPERLRAVLIAEAELGERIMRALILRRVALLELGAGGPVIIGGADQGEVLRLQSFLHRNGHPFQQIDPASDEGARALVERLHVSEAELPLVLCPQGDMLRRPSEQELARCLGLVRRLDAEKVYDVAIVGAGPAGLAAAVYAASEGLSVLALDSRAFGGQAGASARIENYLGFPTGISGIALMARAYNQAQKFGADFAIPDDVTLLESAADSASGRFRLTVGEETALARAVVIASGARYRRLDIDNLEAFEGGSIHYWASPLEGRLCAGQEVALVGGGNSAGQAVVFLAGRVEKVWLLLRGSDLGASMSRYLVDRIRAQPNVEVVTGCEVSRLEGEGGTLDALRWRDRRTGVETRRSLRHLFLFTGADPNTGWLARSGVAVDGKGFVRTGDGLGDGRSALETNRRGIFAIGDVRAGSTKRVGAAVGEGAQVVAALHDFLAEANT